MNRRTLLMAPAMAAAQTKAPIKKVYYRAEKPKTTPLYSEVISSGNLVFVSGHGVNSSHSIGEQTAKVLDDIEGSLKLAGTSLTNALKCNVYLSKLEDYAAMNAAYQGRFGPEPPVRTTVAVAGIPLEGCLVEIEVIAAKPGS